MNPEALRLLRHQAGVATLPQLVELGVSESHVRAQVRARRWQRTGHRCVVTHNHVLTRLQRMWVAVLDPTGLTALAGMSVLETAGFRFFGREIKQIHVVVVRGARYHRFPDVVVHESRRFGPHDVQHRASMPCTRVARSALDAAAWQPVPRYACALIAAVVQQRICTAVELSEQLRYVGRIRHKQHLRLALLDIAGGAEALSEIDIGSLCRRHGLAAPARQQVRRDPSGRRRYLDCEWALPDGRVIVLEVDGSHHFKVESWEADIKRERAIVLTRRTVLRATANEARNEQTTLARDLRAAGVPPSCQAVALP